MKENKFINFNNLLKLILVFIIFYFGKLIQLIPINLLKINMKKMSTYHSILLGTFSNICILITLLIIYRKDLINYWKKFKKSIFKTLDTSFKYYLLGLAGMIITNLLMTFIFKASGANNEKTVQAMISTSPYLMLINAGILGPIIEELVFRKPYMDAFKSKWLYVLTSALVFGSMHVITSATTPIEYLYLIPYASLGFSFAYMDYKENNIFPSIFMHMIHNSILTLLSILV